MTPAQELAGLATALMASLDGDQTRRARGSLTDPSLREWTYLPGERPGVPVETMTAEQRELAFGLLTGLLSEAGSSVVLGAVELERIRRQLASGQADIGGDRYWLRVLGDPADPHQPWGWRINGHHLAVHCVVVADQITVTPHFVGAEPAEVRSGPFAGFRLLMQEEELARDLLADLDPDRRRVAVFADRAPSDILTRFDPVADPSSLPTGLSHASMTARQQDLVQRLVQRYLERAPEPYARRCWQELVDAGLDQLAFSWAGGTALGAGHYYCVTSPSLLIEYDNTQNGANHAHSVWRHLRDDWGADLLRDHYTRQHH